MEAVKIEGCVVKLVERLNENDNETTEWGSVGAVCSFRNFCVSVMVWCCGGLMI